MGAASLRSRTARELVYGQTRAEAIARVQALALRVLADRLRARKRRSRNWARCLRWSQSARGRCNES